MAFHAELGPDKTDLTPGQIIQFQTMKQNYGNGYDPQTGIFTCPRSGLYFFTFTIMAYPGKWTDTKLVHNGSSIASSYSAGLTIDYNTGNKSVLVHLHLGDKVWLEFLAGDKPGNIHGYQWSTLTGLFIKET